MSSSPRSRFCFLLAFVGLFSGFPGFAVMTSLSMALPVECCTGRAKGKDCVCDEEDNADTVTPGHKEPSSLLAGAFVTRGAGAHHGARGESIKTAGSVGTIVVSNASQLILATPQSLSVPIELADLEEGGVLRVETLKLKIAEQLWEVGMEEVLYRDFLQTFYASYPLSSPHPFYQHCFYRGRAAASAAAVGRRLSCECLELL